MKDPKSTMINILSDDESAHIGSTHSSDQKEVEVVSQCNDVKINTNSPPRLSGSMQVIQPASTGGPFRLGRTLSWTFELMRTIGELLMARSIKLEKSIGDWYEQLFVVNPEKSDKCMKLKNKKKG